MESVVQKKRIRARIFIYILGGIVVLVALWIAVYFYGKYQRAQQLLLSSGAVSQMKVNDVIKKVGTIMVLPRGEKPTVATVSDVTKLHNEPFFSEARNGDVVLIYASAKKVILYDPVLNKIVNVGPINIPQSFPTPTPTPSNKNGIDLHTYPSVTVKPSGF